MGRSRGRRARSGRLLRLLGGGTLLVIALLYYKPVRTYFEARHAVGERSAEVRELVRERDSLRRRVARSSSTESLAREARRLGFVEPGERLYIVKGIGAWQRHRRTPARAGHAGG